MGLRLSRMRRNVTRIVYNARKSASSRRNKDGKENVKHHIPGRKNIHPDKRKHNSHRNWTSQKTEVDLGRTRQQNTRQPKDPAYHLLETLRKKKKAHKRWHYFIFSSPRTIISLSVVITTADVRTRRQHKHELRTLPATCTLSSHLLQNCSREPQSQSFNHWHHSRLF